MSTPSKTKPLIAPLQIVLLKKGRCVGCFRELEHEKKEQIDENTIKIYCTCRRIYIHTINPDEYRRASIDEA